jgi:hypothetical protein
MWNYPDDFRSEYYDWINEDLTYNEEQALLDERLSIIQDKIADLKDAISDEEDEIQLKVFKEELEEQERLERQIDKEEDELYKRFYPPREPWASIMRKIKGE